MQVYMAGFFQARINSTINGLPSFLIRPSHLLESYHFMNIRTEKALREGQFTIFLDSGAFSAFTQEAQIDLVEYAGYIRAHQDFVHQAANLDVIAKKEEKRDTAAETYQNQKRLEGLTPGCKIIPVHHARDRDDWLRRYLGEGYDHIALGGMVPESTGYLIEWLDHLFDNYLANPDGSAKVKIHGFGLTSLPLMMRYPWYSVDSTSWVLTSRFGQIYLDLPTGVHKIDFSARSQKRRDLDSWHFQSLAKPQQQIIIDRLAELEAGRVKYPEQEAQLKKHTGWEQGWNVKCLSEQYGWRDNMNIAFFERMSAKMQPKFAKQQETLLT